jgi:predicted phosphohydrolase
MRVHVLSDLHLEFAPFQPNKVDADVIVLAGDIDTGTNGIKWILKTFPDRPAVYILGNHEFYGQNISELISSIKALAQGTNVHVLENNAVEIGSVVFLGATLWTDFRLSGDTVLAAVNAQTRMADFSQIRTTPSNRYFHPADARRLHAQSLEWLIQKAPEARGKSIVVVTHHAPSPHSIPSKFLGDPLNPAFASNLEPFMLESGIRFWIHGHIHHHSDYMIGSSRVIANPRGYPGESDVGFDPSLIIEV